MRVSRVAGKSERIKTHQHNFYTRIQRNMQCHSWATRTKSTSQNEVIGTKFRHLVVKTSQTPYGHSITKQPHSHITDSWGTYQVCPGTNLGFEPFLTLH
ncbi:hypothetical protein M9H77_07147 [Catharanthus roseus]|uniref:Uncharacterized protein n=1 Tax=Catharanthus roseus TaxID=4058 RepID=A0ACC0BUD2_CATRO|nr:hypothetical protein M9H77_07147 [Catharanthus roseus]